MRNENINPDTNFESIKMGYSHAVKSSGSVMIHCSGQVAWDKDYNLVGVDDVGKQTHQVLENLKLVLEASGAGIDDIVSLRTYVVNLNPSLLEPIGKAMSNFYGSTKPAANTMIGVDSLALPDFLIEIEATAVKD